MFTLPEGVEHGTPEGWAAGCRSEKTCPALYTHGMCCVYAHIRSQTDVRYFKAKQRDPSPAAIAARLGIAPLPSRDVEKIAAQDDEFAARGENYRYKARRPRPPAPAPEPSDTDHQEPAMPEPERPTTDDTPAKSPTPVDAATAPITTDKWTAGMSATEKALTLRSIREWARANGFPGVPTRGRIPQDALAAFDTAHPHGIPQLAHTTPPATDDKAAALELHKAGVADTDIPAATALAERPVTDDDVAHRSDLLDETRQRIAPSPHGKRCPQKVRYGTVYEAEKALKSIQAKSPDRENRAYLCPHCHGYHLTSQPKKTTRPPRPLHNRVADAFPTDVTALPRPDWADVTIPEDIERLRTLAAHLEAELARVEPERDAAHAALPFLLRSWDGERAARLQAEHDIDLLVAEINRLTLNVLRLETDLHTYKTAATPRPPRLPWKRLAR